MLSQLPINFSEYPEVIAGVALFLIVLSRKLKIWKMLAKIAAKLLLVLRWAFILLVIFIPISIYRSWVKHSTQEVSSHKTSDYNVDKEKPLSVLDSENWGKNIKKLFNDSYSNPEKEPSALEELLQQTKRKRQLDREQQDPETIEDDVALKSPMVNRKQLRTLKKQARSLYRNNQLKEALEIFSQIIQIDPYQANNYIARAVVYSDLKMRREALQDYDQAIEINPISPETYNNRGTLYQEMEDWQSALDDYDTAISLDPKFAHAYINRGQVLKKLGKLEEAIQSWEYAIVLKSPYENMIRQWIQQARKEQY